MDTLLLLPCLPLLSALLLGLWGARLPRTWVSLIACGSVLGATALAVQMAHGLALTAGTPLLVSAYTWMDVAGLQLTLGLSCDRLAATLLLLICGVGSLIHVYSVGYMADEPGLARYFAYLNLFVAAMLLLVLADSLPLMFVGWEGVGLCSYLLIGFWYDDPANASAGMKAFVVNRIGDCGLLVAMFILASTVGSLSFAEINLAAVSGMIPAGLAGTLGLLLLLGAAGKSAQGPLYVWLPDAMAGPTPVSALIHAATMVTAGVYLVCRLHPLFELAPAIMLTMACMGACTALLGALLATVQTDIKRVLAYSTVSQLGFMFMAAGCGAYAVAILHVVTHAFFKACLFLGAGAVIHGVGGNQDMRRMGRLAPSMPVTASTFAVAALALCGVPPLSGFISKDAVLWAVWTSGSGRWASTFAAFAVPLWLTGLAAASCTAFYMGRLYWLTFAGPTYRGASERLHHGTPASMAAPLLLLAALAALGGGLAWPHLFGGEAWLLTWLAPSLGAPAPLNGSVQAEKLAMAAAVGATLLGFGLAWRLAPGALNPAPAAAVQFWRRSVAAGFYVDALYQRLLVKPCRLLARYVLEAGVERVLNAFVQLWAQLAQLVGFALQLLQNGNLQRYLAIFVLALTCLLAAWHVPMAGLSRRPVLMQLPAGGETE